MRPTPTFTEGPFARANIFYDVEDVRNALKLFIKVAGDFENSETFRYDIVDLTRQAMSDKSQELLRDLKEAYNEKDIEAFKKKSQFYLDAIRDLDLVLLSDSMFLVSTWLNKARNRAHNKEQLKLYEFNARNLITQWGPKDTQLKDYAQRQYGGMMGDFNYKRWKLFFDDATAALESDKPLDWITTDSKISVWEDKWANSIYEYTTKTESSYVEQIKKVYEIYLEE
jgi:alpha-N-acetylglucosaminidase